MAPYSCLCCARCLVYVDLLDGLAWCVLLAAPDGVVEDDDFLDTGELGAEQGFYFLIVALANGGVVGEELLVGWGGVDGESGVVGGEFMFSASQVVDGARMRFALEVVSRTVNLGPWLACI